MDDLEQLARDINRNSRFESSINTDVKKQKKQSILGLTGSWIGSPLKLRKKSQALDEDLPDCVPETFDPKLIQQEKANSCKWCKACFGFFKPNSRRLKIKQKRHNCIKCGASICDECISSSKIRLSRQDKSLYKVCCSCQTIYENQKLINFFTQIVHKKEKDNQEIIRQQQELNKQNQIEFKSI